MLTWITVSWLLCWIIGGLFVAGIALLFLGVFLWEMVTDTIAWTRQAFGKR